MWKHTQKTENQKLSSTNLILRPEIRTIRARRTETNELAVQLIAANLCLTFSAIFIGYFSGLDDFASPSNNEHGS